MKIHVIDDEDDFVVNLKQVDSFLANENLPIWTVSEDADSKLIPDKTVWYQQFIINRSNKYHRLRR